MTRETWILLFWAYLILCGLWWIYRDVAPGVLFRHYAAKALRTQHRDAFWREFNRHVGLGDPLAAGIRRLGVWGLRRCYQVAVLSGEKDAT